jgi:hypothetical protein
MLTSYSSDRLLIASKFCIGDAPGFKSGIYAGYYTIGSYFFDTVGTSSILGSSESIFTLDSSFSYFVFG